MDFIARFMRKKVYAETSRFVQTWLNHGEFSDDDLDSFIQDYKALMKLVLCRCLGVFGNLDHVIEDACYGNWEHLWETDGEKSMTVADFVEYITGEVFYCSDRWSWDRFLRVNWAYQRIQYRKLREKLSNDRI